jgi:RNA polymerase sigma-70 factor (ECF subfamily)
MNGLQPIVVTSGRVSDRVARDVTEPDLRALMGRYCDGDADAFRALYDAVAARLLHYARSMLQDRAAAEDVLQRAFIRVHHARATYVRGADPVPWLYTITHRMCLDELRARRRRRAVIESPREDARPVEPRATLDGAAEDADRAEPLDARDQALYGLTMAALGELTEEQRDALVLTKLHGHSVAEAAAILGTTPGAVKLRAHRAYERLRALVKPRAEERDA